MNGKYEKQSRFELIGPVFMTGIPGTIVDDETDVLIQEYCPGGVILFSRNIENPLQLASLCNDLQQRALKYHGTPLFISIDQEGGRVARLEAPFTRFPGNEAIGKDRNAQKMAADFARITAKEMSLVGLNMDFAPVLDVAGDAAEKHLVGRMLGNDPKQVAMLGETVINILQKNGIMATAKHYPGLGPANLDPHHQLPTIHAHEREIKEIHLLPFMAAIKSNVAAIMTSHALYPNLDPDVPATLSYRIMTGLLRDSLGFKGLLISDDLEMGAIKKGWGVSEGAVASFEAGSDILLICKDQNAVQESIHLMMDRIQINEITHQRLQQSLFRIKKAKSEYLKDYKPASLEDVRAYFQL